MANRADLMRSKFGEKKWGVIVVDRGKVKSTDAIELPSGVKIREIEEDR